MRWRRRRQSHCHASSHHCMRCPIVALLRPDHANPINRIRHRSLALLRSSTIQCIFLRRRHRAHHWRQYNIFPHNGQPVSNRSSFLAPSDGGKRWRRWPSQLPTPTLTPPTAANLHPPFSFTLSSAGEYILRPVPSTLNRVNPFICQCARLHFDNGFKLRPLPHSLL